MRAGIKDMIQHEEGSYCIHGFRVNSNSWVGSNIPIKSTLCGVFSQSLCVVW